VSLLLGASKVGEAGSLSIIGSLGVVSENDILH
jgi:hypothetical protein